MARRQYTAEQIIGILRQVAVAVSNGRSTPQACGTRASLRFLRGTQCSVFSIRKATLRTRCATTQLVAFSLHCRCGTKLLRTTDWRNEKLERRVFHFDVQGSATAIHTCRIAVAKLYQFTSKRGPFLAV
jgi:hypothetical protein